jgi:hypothetical protein
MVHEADRPGSVSDFPDDWKNTSQAVETNQLQGCYNTRVR